ncbi:Acg family FMN-binding oxidoreductase [Mycobacterium helveticum]|uniref:NAD(P)H nitroreductase n=1 Tax=Mycobacterium helveticum TaxID=2592811 RepID=A0A557XRZ9_9MYCO|nr:NAD(P)H nitroreductase [Mycobacterium helveticum]TVS85268.1 NAD(P)H nitroreductase [Mycobacterium helveticum]TVS88711.1 NAD(P)H nitroreductase [Mycobacterium helveticum]
MGKTPDTEVLRGAVQLACRAPSVHNSQPWRWVAGDGVVHLYLDRRRMVPGTDRSGRQALISCGAVLDHFRVAMLAAGWRAVVDRFPSPGDPDRVASIEFRSVDHVAKSQRDHAEAILHRRTDRLPLGQPTYWNLFEPSLRGVVADGPVRLDVLSDDVRPLLAKASQLSGLLRRDDASYHAELDWWTSPFALTEGIPPSALASEKEHRRVDVGREFPARGHGDRRPEVGADWSKILVVSSAEDTGEDALRCGEALSTVLLECTLAFLATCTLTHLIELEESRDIVRRLLDEQGQPQLLIRAGIAPRMEFPPAPTPRRPVDEVLEIR